VASGVTAADPASVWAAFVPVVVTVFWPSALVAGATAWDELAG
jgi:hypothetical protein